MKICENCGVSLGDDYSFATCPRCLFGQALSPAQGAVAPPASGPEATRFSRLKIRADFFQRYELLERIAGGGQGDIWKVWDLEFRRTVAMKRLRREAGLSEPVVYRFLAEAQITSQLGHPGILPIFDAGLDADGNPFYTTQLMPGATFARVWAKVQAANDAAWTLNRALELLVRVCEVMAHAHSRGVIHRDLKPANVLVGDFGDVRVIDWGSAAILGPKLAGFEESFVRLQNPPVETDRSDASRTGPDSDHATANAGLPITPLFTPPELLLGDWGKTGPAADIYSLGVMLYELLAGRPPYAGADGELGGPAQLREMILAGPPARLRSVNPAVSRDLAAICEQAMAREPANRYPSVERLADDLRAVLEVRPVQARRPGPGIILQKWALRHFSQVVIASASVAALSLVLSVAHGLKVQRDSARQTQDLRNAELAARNGHWREAIQYWDQVAADGYGDSIYIDLQKAEAWTELAEPDRSGALLKTLAARSDLGGQRGVVLLRFGEHELFDRQTAADGIKLVNDALAAGLTNADLLFARGLLADSTPVALDLFHQALHHDPYHHGAHVQSLSLEWLLGHHQELANHLSVFRILYPDDPAPDFIAAAEAAMAGDLAGARAQLAAPRYQVNANIWEDANQYCRAYAAAAKFYDLDTLLNEAPPGRTPLDKLRTDPLSAGVMLMPGDFTAITNRTASRTAWLPCIQQGIMVGSDGVQRLCMPFFVNPAVAIREIESGWRHHPEALLPVLGGMLLENLQPKTGPPTSEIMQMQARLYQTGADSSAMIPAMSRLARYLAARTEFELATRDGTNSPADRTNCLENIRLAAASPATSPAEYRAYFPFALELGDHDLALQLASLLEKREPDDPAGQRDRIQAELALGAFGPALDKIDRLLAANPHDPSAQAQRQAALAGAKAVWDANANSHSPFDTIKH